MALTDQDRELVAAVRRSDENLPFGARGAVEALARFAKPSATDARAIADALGARGRGSAAPPNTGPSTEYTRRYGTTQVDDDEASARAFWGRFDKEHS